MKKLLLFIFIAFLFMIKVDAKSVDDLYNELNNLESQKELYLYLNDEEIEKIIKEETNIEIVIENLNEEINHINNEILEKEENIEKIKKEIDNLLVFNQKTKGENVYLEYIFDSDSYSEMIYRYMIVKQITEYNDNLVKKLHSEIDSLNQKKEELEKKVQEINKKREEFKKIEILLKSNSLNNIESIKTSLDEDIIYLRKEIEKYENLGCSRYIDLNICLNIKDNNSLMYPLAIGCVTKDYIVSNSENHKGIDLGCNKEGSDVYSSGYGIVAQIIKESSCGGNIIWIYNKLHEKEYTTIYAHLLEVKVNVGDIVDYNTVIGTVGGESTSILNGGYDKCTNGAHLHYALVEGYHTNDYNIYTFNPRYMNNYPNVLNGYFRR